MSEFYTYSDTLIPNTVARSADLKAELEAIEAGLDKLPTEAQLKLGTAQYGTDAGSANTYVVTLPYTPAAYTAGMVVRFKATASNTGASTVNVNAKGVKNIKRPDGTALQADDISASGMTTLVYDGTNFIVTDSLVSIVGEATAQVALAAAQVALAQTARTGAETAETNAETAVTNAEAVYDAFDDRYLGAKATDPTLDNDGNALITGALYWNTAVGEMRVWAGSSWSVAYTVGTTASQAEMEAGTESGLRAMSPLRVAQAIAAQASDLGLGAAATTLPATLTASSPGLHAVSASWYGMSLTLPDATTLSEGVTVFTLHNAGAYPFKVVDSTGAGLGFVEPDTNTICALADNSTAAGTWHLLGASAAAIDASAAVSIGTVAYTGFYLQAVALDSDRTLLLLHSTALYGGVYDSASRSFGTWTLIRNANVGIFVTAIKSATDQALVISAASTAFEAVVLSISGTTITVNTAATTTTLGAINVLAPVLQVGSAFITAQCCDSVSTQARAATISGTTVTIGTAQVLSGTTRAHLVPLTSSAFLTISQSTSGAVACLPFTVSGTTLTSGTVYNASATSAEYIVEPLASGRVALIAINNPNVVGHIISVATNVATGTTVNLGPVTPSWPLCNRLVVGSQVLFVNTSVSANNLWANVLTDNAGTAVAGTQVGPFVCTDGTVLLGRTASALYILGEQTSDSVWFAVKVTISGNNPVMTLMKKMVTSTLSKHFSVPDANLGAGRGALPATLLLGTNYQGNFGVGGKSEAIETVALKYPGTAKEGIVLARIPLSSVAPQFGTAFYATHDGDSAVWFGGVAMSPGSVPYTFLFERLRAV